MTMVPPNIASPASRQIMYAGLGVAVSMGVAATGRAISSAPDADGSSPGRIDRAEARGIFSGLTAPSTLLPLAGALLCIPMLYTKGRVVMGGPKGLSPAITQAVEAAGTKVVPNELARTKSLYTYLGGSILGGVVAEPVVFGGEPKYETRHVLPGARR